jgi:hypothetical protein
MLLSTLIMDTGNAGDGGRGINNMLAWKEERRDLRKHLVAENGLGDQQRSTPLIKSARIPG